jgi:hypothetical protein
MVDAAQEGSRLVKNAGRRARHLVLGLPAELDQFRRFEAGSQQVVEGHCHGAFQCSGRREPGPDGDVGPQLQLQAGNFHTALGERPHDAERIGSPARHGAR